MLKLLEIRNVRSIESAQFVLHKPLNVFWGNNGSGKTSILEAINILSCGKSFRNAKCESVITSGKSSLSVSGNVVRDIKEYSISVVRGGIGQSVKLGQRETGTAQIAKLFPVMALSADSQSVVDGSPDLRRSLIDWGMFHVEPNYYGLWKHFRDVLTHRNALIKQCAHRSLEWKVWEKRFLEISEELTLIRKRHTERLNEGLCEVFNNSGFTGDVSLRLFAGWNQNESLKVELDRNLDNDLRLGYTKLGPHRYDIEVTVNGNDSKKHLSRGQQKIVVYSLAIVQSKLFQEQERNMAVLLADEMLAELDASNSQRLLEQLTKNFSQIFLTFNGESLPKILNSYDYDLFHVEHGSIFQ